MEVSQECMGARPGPPLLPLSLWPQVVFFMSRGCLLFKGVYEMQGLKRLGKMSSAEITIYIDKIAAGLTAASLKLSLQMTIHETGPKYAEILLV